MLKKFVAASANPQLPKTQTRDESHYEEEPVTIGLVLTGGGSHGAFEAGVLEAILPELNRLGKIAVITGTSAGAVNAIAAGSGLNASGPDEAINRLRKTWDTITQANGNLLNRWLRFFSDAVRPPNERWPNLPQMTSGISGIFQEFKFSYVAQFISKTVKDIVGDWKTEVQNGSVKICANTIFEKRGAPGTFEHYVLSGEDLTPDGVGGSANLKPLGCHFIKDTKNPEHLNRLAYDGAYRENGSLDPHFANNVTDCIMIILYDRRHNELDKGELKHAEIHSNALNMSVSDSSPPMRFHAIEIESLGGEIGGLAHMDDSSKLNTDSEFVNMLYEAGLEAGRKWLEKNRDHIGLRTSYPFYKPALEQYTEMNYA